MKLLARRRQADAALATLQKRERAWRTNTRVVRAWCMRHRAGLIAGGGVGAGFVTSMLPIAPLMRLISGLAATASVMLEGPFLRLLTAAHREASSAEASTKQ